MNPAAMVGKGRLRVEGKMRKGKAKGGVSRHSALAVLRRAWRADRALASTAKGLDRLMSLVLAASAVLFALGITFPVMRVTELWVFRNEFSILDGIGKLWFQGEALLAVVVAAFSIAFPVTKILLAWVIWHYADAKRPHFRLFLRFLIVSGRWSMADVFVIATAIMIAKITGFADATSQPGLYYFMGSLALVTLATLRIERAGEKVG